MFDLEGFKFSGTFPESCQMDSVPESLKTLVTMILFGPAYKKKDSQACLSISQLLFFNSKKKDNQATYVSHSKEREPPLPIYLGLMVHSQTRSKKLVQTFFELGFSISYSRVTQLEQKLASSLCEQYAKDQAVIPASLKDSSFTVCAVDNIDHNLSSTTATISFHGTSISYHQHITESSKDRPKFILSDQNYDIKLPESYSVVPCLDEIVTNAEPPKLTVFHPHFDGSEEIKKEDDWLKDSQRMFFNIGSCPKTLCLSNVYKL